jgi:hypothetical protein
VAVSDYFDTRVSASVIEDDYTNVPCNAAVLNGCVNVVNDMTDQAIYQNSSHPVSGGAVYTAIQNISIPSGPSLSMKSTVIALNSNWKNLNSYGYTYGNIGCIILNIYPNASIALGSADSEIGTVVDSMPACPQYCGGAMFPQSSTAQFVSPLFAAIAGRKVYLKMYSGITLAASSTNTLVGTIIYLGQ